MTDRLKQIWKGFETRTSSRLTSVDIDAVNVPLREERSRRETGPEHSLEAGKADHSEAVRAALSALQQDILAKGKKHRRKRRGPETQPGFSLEEGALPSSLEDNLLTGLKFTEARTRRSGSDYISFAQSRQDAWKKRRKKFLGIF
jgi:Arc/MetJ-type ribon-helix-helix transcriptional regulator